MIEATVRVGVTDEGEVRVWGKTKPYDFAFYFGPTIPESTGMAFREWLKALPEAEGGPKCPSVKFEGTQWVEDDQD